MKTLKDIKLESSVHNLLIRTVKNAMEDLQYQERDIEDGVWPDLSDHLEAVSMTIINLVKGEA